MVIADGRCHIGTQGIDFDAWFELHLEMPELPGFDLGRVVLSLQWMEVDHRALV